MWICRAGVLWQRDPQVDSEVDGPRSVWKCEVIVPWAGAAPGLEVHSFTKGGLDFTCTGPLYTVHTAQPHTVA